MAKTAYNGLSCSLLNDADACALAEWKYGAGRGTRNLVFLTFATGLEAGLILNGKLYAGACGAAGEAGHIRLVEDGPEGYGKKGSFEGFCSGGGILCFSEKYFGSQKSAKEAAELAAKGDPLAMALFQEVGRRLGQGLSVIIDLLNPEAVVLGGVYMRAPIFRGENVAAAS